MKELKPCPFCGSEAKFVFEHTQAGPNGERAVRVMCTGEGMHALDSWNPNKEYAAEDWNTRHSPWRPIEEAPHDDTAVLVGRFKDEEPELLPEPGVWDEDYQKWFSSIRDTDLLPTHFMEIPQPPEEK